MVSSEGSEFGSSGSTDTDLTVSNWLVGKGVFSEEMTNHIGFDFNGVPVFSTVAVNNRSAHLWHDDGVSEMSLNTLWFLTDNGVLLGDIKFLLKSIVLSVDSVSESSLLSGFHESDNFGSVHIEKFIEFVSSVNLLLERLFLNDLLL